MDRAIECYTKAANLFKMEKLWWNAGQAFSDGANLFNEKYKAAVYYTEAANCFKKCDVDEAINCHLKAVEIYVDLGRFSLAAKHHQTIAELFETEKMNLETAIQHYEQAVDYFNCDKTDDLSVVSCQLKIANLSALLSDYIKAISVYQEITKRSKDSSILLKYGVKEYIFRELLCQLCVDVTEAKGALEWYERTCPIFQDSREDRVMKKVVECATVGDVDGFTEAVTDYDQVAKLDQWFTTLLLVVKKEIANKSSTHNHKGV